MKTVLKDYYPLNYVLFLAKKKLTKKKLYSFFYLKFF